MATTTIAPAFTQKSLSGGVGFFWAGDVSKPEESFVRWQNLEGCRVDAGYCYQNPNSIYKDTGALGVYTGRAISIQQVVGTGAKASVKNIENHQISFGLNSLTWTAGGTPRNVIEWCVEIVPHQGQLKFYETGALKNNIVWQAYLKDADVELSVQDTGSDIQVFEGDTSIYTFPGTTSTYAAGDTYYFDLGLATLNGRLTTCKLEGTYL